MREQLQEKRKWQIKRVPNAFWPDDYMWIVVQPSGLQAEFLTFGEAIRHFNGIKRVTA